MLPPYSPDRNPGELVWKHLKADIAGRMAATSREAFTKKVRRSIRNLQNDARKIIPNTSFISPSRISTIPEPGPRARKRQPAND